MHVLTEELSNDNVQNHSHSFVEVNKLFLTNKMVVGLGGFIEEVCDVLLLTNVGTSFLRVVSLDLPPVNLSDILLIQVAVVVRISLVKYVSEGLNHLLVR
jgi:hypothetical protein